MDVSLMSWGQQPAKSEMYGQYGGLRDMLGDGFRSFAVSGWTYRTRDLGVATAFKAISTTL